MKISSQKKNKKNTEQQKNEAKNETPAKEPKIKPEKKAKAVKAESDVQMKAKDLVESRVITEKNKEKKLEKSTQVIKKKNDKKKIVPVHLVKHYFSIFLSTQKRKSFWKTMSLRIKKSRAWRSFFTSRKSPKS